jgi:hypothetical protein
MRPLVLLALVAAAFGAADFWASTPPEKWTPEQFRKIRSSSPWAKTVTATAKERITSSEGVYTASNTSRYGRGGSVMVERSAAEGEPGGLQPPSINVAVPGEKAIVRWESALPIREAARRFAGAEDPAGDGADGSLVVSLTMAGGAVERIPRGADQQASYARWLDSAATLKLPGAKETLKPAKVTFADSPEGPMALFHFPRPAGLPSSGEAVFTCRMWPLTYTARFPLPAMRYQGKLEL